MSELTTLQSSSGKI